ncbi:MAG: hypothetical protein LQ350_007196 [Teloschistes chrysophthalmus]|nr:MAG: hypothetical protein LQ350_007196 [Niorma chrysophthalma]
MKPSSHLLIPVTVSLGLGALAAAQGTVVLNLATSNDETASTISVPFNTLFDASKSPSGVSIQVNIGSNVPVSQEEIACQCFSDQSGSKPLGDMFNNVFPGTRISQEPVRIGSILCSDAAGVKKQMAAVGGTGSSSGGVQVQTTSAAAVNAATNSPFSISTATILPTATPASQATSNAQSSSSSLAQDAPVAIVKFSHSTDPSDDTASQISVPIDSSITTFTSKRAASVTIVTTSGVPQQASGDVLCQAFTDPKAVEPIAAGFRLEKTMSFGGLDVQAVGAVGCAMIGGKGFGGALGLVGV